jgi:hypothetical protein
MVFKILRRKRPEMIATDFVPFMKISFSDHLDILTFSKGKNTKS